MNLRGRPRLSLETANGRWKSNSLRSSSKKGRKKSTAKPESWRKERIARAVNKKLQEIVLAEPKASICAAMAKLYCTTFLAICATIVVIISCLSSTVYGGQALGWIPTRSLCEDSIGGCLGGDEFEFDSEISRRILATTQYISYAALQRNSVPCSRRGASYYNCQPGAQANPYSRGCSAITRCRS